jgi:hypothetical protein
VLVGVMFWRMAAMTKGERGLGEWKVIEARVVSVRKRRKQRRSVERKASVQRGKMVEEGERETILLPLLGPRNVMHAKTGAV